MIEKEAKVLIILGMHRSGTSVVAQWLHQCGLNIGEKLLGPEIGNVEGHFEDVDFYRYHEDVLEDNHVSKYGFIDHPIRSLSFYQEQKIRSIINFKTALHAEWGWKEPRTCLFLRSYRKLIPCAQYLIIIRDFHATVNSLIVRDFKTAYKKYLTSDNLSARFWTLFKKAKRREQYYRKLSAHYLNVWITYNTEILKHLQYLQPRQYVVVDYNLLLNNDQQTFDTLTHRWHFNMNYVEFKNVFNNKLISMETDIEPFIEDKALLNRAYEVQYRLSEYY